jgi:hypothetical protein
MLRSLARSFAPFFLAASLLGGACVNDMGGEPPAAHAQSASHLTVIDTDGDGIPDALDVDGDGTADVSLGAPCDAPLVDADADGVPDGLDLDCDGTADVTWCTHPIIDADGDGVPDGIDLNCDGTAEVTLPTLPPLPTPTPPAPPTPPTGTPTPPTPPGTGGLCLPRPIDADGDGRCDGLDLDCDGVADVSF